MPSPTPPFPPRVGPPYAEWAAPLTKVYEEITDQILVNIARHFNVTDSGTGSVEWQFKQLAEMGQLTKENIATIAKLTGQNETLTTIALEQAANAALEQIEPTFRAAVKAGYLADTSPGKSARIESLLRAYQEQAISKQNLVNTVMLESSLTAYRRVVSNTLAYEQGIMRASQKATAQAILNEVTGEVVTGVSSRTAALRKALKQMTNEGLTGFVDRAGHNWTPEAYINMDIRTTCGNVATEAAFERNRDYGNDLVWVPIHAQNRPGCYPYIGKVLSMDNRSGTVEDFDGSMIPFMALNQTTYGQAAGLFGINCSHTPPNPFLPGYSSIRGEIPDAATNEERYNTTQQQRIYERQVRYAKRDAAVVKASGDEELFRKEAQKVQNAQARLRGYEKEHGLDHYADRSSVAGYTKDISNDVRKVKGD